MPRWERHISCRVRGHGYEVRRRSACSTNCADGLGICGKQPQPLVLDGSQHAFKTLLFSLRAHRIPLVMIAGVLAARGPHMRRNSASSKHSFTHCTRTAFRHNTTNIFAPRTSSGSSKMLVFVGRNAARARGALRRAYALTTISAASTMGTARRCHQHNS